VRLRVLGSAGGESADYRATSLLVNDRLLVDAGSVMQALDFEAQSRVSHALVTHPHLDHVKDLGFLVDNTFGQRERPLRVIAPAPVIGDLRAHLFNWVIWPDFSELPTPEDPVMAWVPLEDSIEIEGLRVDACAVNHPGNAYGYVIEDLAEDVSILVTGDTSTTDAIWEVGLARENLAAVFVDVAFPNRMRDIARVSGHFTPACFDDELRKLGEPDLPFYLYHLKPVHHDEVVADVAALRRANLTVVEDGDEFAFSPRRAAAVAR
jgi:cAMP phosphodiesterase